MRQRLFTALLLCLLSGGAVAQQAPPVTTYGGQAYSGNSSSTIASTNVWQKIWSAPTNDSPRKGCLVLNQGTHTMWVYFQGPGVATPSGSGSEASAVPLNAAASSGAAGGWVGCTVGGAVLQDTIWVTGTSGDAYYAAQQ